MSLCNTILMHISYRSTNNFQIRNILQIHARQIVLNQLIICVRDAVVSNNIMITSIYVQFLLFSLQMIEKCWQQMMCHGVLAFIQ